MENVILAFIPNGKTRGFIKGNRNDAHENGWIICDEPLINFFQKCTSYVVTEPLSGEFIESISGGYQLNCFFGGDRIQKRAKSEVSLLNILLETIQFRYPTLAEYLSSLEMDPDADFEQNLKP